MVIVWTSKCPQGTSYHKFEVRLGLNGFCQWSSMTKSGCDTIEVVVDGFKKYAVFMPMKETGTMERLAKAYVKHVVRLHGVPKVSI